MRRNWCLPLATSGFALCVVLVLLFFTPSTTLAATNTGQGARGLSTAYMNGYRQGYQNACNGGAANTGQYPTAAGKADYNAGYQQGYQYGTSSCNNQPATGMSTPAGNMPAGNMPAGMNMGTPAGMNMGVPYGMTSTPYQATGYNNGAPMLGAYSSPNGSYTPAYGTNEAPTFTVQTNVTVSGNH